MKSKVLNTIRFIYLLCTFAAPVAAAELKVFACEPEWAALVAELAGGRATVTTATTAAQDVHTIQARPSLIAAARRADLVVCGGASLEVGWLPLLLRQSTNNKVMPGQPGYFEAALEVPLLEVPAVVDRAAGDIHPFGNPHVQLDPRNIARVATALSRRLRQLDPAGEADYRARLDDFQGRWSRALAGWEARAAPLAGLRLVVHHNSWVYLAAWLHLDIVGYLEPKPGLPPTSGHLAELLAKLKNRPPAVIVRSAYQSERPSAWLAERTGAPAIELPHTVDGDEIKDLFSMFDEIVRRLAAVAGTP